MTSAPRAAPSRPGLVARAELNGPSGRGGVTRIIAKMRGSESMWGGRWRNGAPDVVKLNKGAW